MKPNLSLKDQKTQWMILIAVGSLAVFIVYINLFFKPLVADLVEINPKLRKFSCEIRETERYIKDKPNMESQLKELKAKIGNYKVLLSGEEEIPSLLEELSDIARKSDVKIIGIKPKMTAKLETEKKKRLPYEEIPISIKADCGYHQLGHFISRLENANRLFYIRDIDIKSNPQSQRSHNVNITVSTFLISEN